MKVGVEGLVASVSRRARRKCVVANSVLKVDVADATVSVGDEAIVRVERTGAEREIDLAGRHGQVDIGEAAPVNVHFANDLTGTAKVPLEAACDERVGRIGCQVIDAVHDVAKGAGGRVGGRGGDHL